jgi:hypothetical protein
VRKAPSISFQTNGDGRRSTAASGIFAQLYEGSNEKCSIDVGRRIFVYSPAMNTNSDSHFGNFRHSRIGSMRLAAEEMTKLFSFTSSANSDQKHAMQNLHSKNPIHSPYLHSLPGCTESRRNAPKSALYETWFRIVSSVPEPSKQRSEWPVSSLYTGGRSKFQINFAMLDVFYRCL